MAGIAEFWNKIKTGWSNLSNNKKIALLVVACSVIIAAIVYGMSLGKTEYVPVFTNLDIQDSSEIIATLDSMNFSDYRLEDNGTTIMVPEQNVDRLRLDLAIEGVLPNSGEGFELFDDSGYAMTDADREILYQRALQGELERSIQSLEEVEKARVHLALSQDSIFMKEKEPASASIILTLKKNGGQSLSPEQIRGIISLVSGAVKNLPEENVRIVDSQANLLSNGVLKEEDPFQSPGGSSQMMDLEKQFESNLKNDLETMLEQVFGVGKIAVAIKADLDFDSEESTVISYNPQAVIRSQQIRINRNGGDSGQGEGSSPIDNNTQNYIDGNIDQILEDGFSSYESITNNEIGETTTYTRRAPGQVRRVSASIVYDGSLSAEQRQAIESIAMAAIGYDAQRGDAVYVEGVPFDNSLQDQLERQLAEEQARLEEAEAAEAAKEAALRLLIAYIVMGILLAGGIAIIIGLIVRGRRKKAKVPVLDAQIDEPISVEELLREPVITIESREERESAEERSIKEYAQNNPDDAADLVRAWVLEDER